METDRKHTYINILYQTTLYARSYKHGNSAKLVFYTKGVCQWKYGRTFK